ncbi:tubby-like F-box protein 3 isoform X2 [Olea europaea var. sylvestris]|uniref:tubby-like F-box protein 3 isoform X2 n=1 Tax=Olea europaea var. sylvestris TaxID=158386 RepID=UPI000C1D6307|nr:tubby-like F-box protein 3 isoform X2 [Olea europaea var. sylvestris]
MIKSIIHDMGIGSLSWTRSELKFYDGLPPMVLDGSITAKDSLKLNCLANLPLELLRGILTRVEESGCNWPQRKNVVACAGVCRIWREIMKEITRSLEVSGKLTFPIALKQPGPRNTLIQCFIKRNRDTQTYHLYLNLNQASNDDGKFLLSAQRFRCTAYTEYIISLIADDASKDSTFYVGKLRSNFLRTKFTIYDVQPPNAGAKVTKSHSTKLAGMKLVSRMVPSGNYPVAHISYEVNILGSRGPRRMQCVMDSIPSSAIEPGGMVPVRSDFPLGNRDSFLSIPFFRSKSTSVDSFQSGPLSTFEVEMLSLKNKSPRWNEQLQCWCLNFNGRVTVASVKNFQLVAFVENGAGGQEHEDVILQFGKVAKDVFTMDYQYPISAFQAFAICLSSFDSRTACE